VGAGGAVSWRESARAGERGRGAVRVVRARHCRTTENFKFKIVARGCESAGNDECMRRGGAGNDE